VLRIAGTLDRWPFEVIYGSSWDKVIAAGAKTVLAQSVQRYVKAVSAPSGD
jgi:N6-adenosine-specific RNA methylase IME4